MAHTHQSPSPAEPSEAAADALSGLGRHRRAMLRGLSSASLLPLVSVPTLAAAATIVPVRPAQAAQGYNPPLLDPLTDLKTLFSVGLDAIPYVGGALSALLGLLWPVGAADLWSQIKDRIAGMIDGKIQDFYRNELEQLLDGLHGAVGNYLLAVKQLADAKTPADRQQAQDQIRSFADALQTQFSTLVPKFTGAAPDTAWKALPLYVQVANLHFGFLVDFLKHSPDYGNEPSVVSQYHEFWRQAHGDYAQYVDKTLAQAEKALEAERLQSVRNFEHVPNTNRYSYRDGIATGAWWGLRDYNAKNNEYTLLVRDFRELWKNQGDPTLHEPPTKAPPLTRGLWYGPYGAPSLFDIGWSGDTWNIDALPDPLPALPRPGQPQGVRKLTYLSGRGMRWHRSGHSNLWDFPTNVACTYDNAAPNTQSGWFGISLADQWGGPVVSIKVHIGHYYSATSSGGFGNQLNTGGRLVSALEFVQERDPSALHRIGADDSYGYEMKDYATEVWTAPAGHELLTLTSTSAVGQLWNNVGLPGQHSIGSIMFCCRLKDPTLKPTPRQLGMLYASSPQKLGVRDLAGIWYDLIEPTPADEAGYYDLLDDIRQKIAVYQLDEHRALFWSQWAR
ncbi:MAG: insecticidal delta-endotoxin Cry8Ea1 family protein [Comamonas sp.]